MVICGSCGVWAIAGLVHLASTRSRVMYGLRRGTKTVEADQGLDPALAIEIAPLVGETEVGLYDAAADRLEVHHARVASHVARDPGAEIVVEGGIEARVDGPVLEGSLMPGHAGGMADPDKPAAGDGAIAGEGYERLVTRWRRVAALEQAM